MTLTTLALMLFLTPQPAAPPAEAGVGATIADFAWLAGDWHGEMNDSVIEETWSAPGGGTMMGMFRWLTDDGVRLYEFLALETAGDSVELRLRHFSPGFEAWEEKDAPMVFRCVESEGQKAVFHMKTDEEDTRLTFERNDGQLTVTLDKRVGERHSVIPFVYTLR
ncbi:MAG: DUF6265 family protein [Acidobacteriota bacterium]